MSYEELTLGYKNFSKNYVNNFHIIFNASKDGGGQ